MESKMVGFHTAYKLTTMKDKVKSRKIESQMTTNIIENMTGLQVNKVICGG